MLVGPHPHIGLQTVTWVLDGEVLHHVAYRVPDTGPALEQYRKAGMVEIAQGKWPEGEAHWGTFHYVQDPRGGAVIEFISRIPRR